LNRQAAKTAKGRQVNFVSPTTEYDATNTSAQKLDVEGDEQAQRARDRRKIERNHKPSLANLALLASWRFH
jgi:hypothetical protein